MNLKLFSKIGFSIFCFFQLGYQLAHAASDIRNGNFLVQPWAVGQSITLQTKTYNDGALVRTEKTTYSIVDQETVRNKNYFWLEIETDTDGQYNILQKLQVRQFKDLDFVNFIHENLNVLKVRRRFQKMIVASGHHASGLWEYEVPSAAVHNAEVEHDPSATRYFTPLYEIKTNQPAVVPAGSFDATLFHRHVAAKNLTDDWGSPNVPIFGVVKRSFQNTNKSGAVVKTETELLSYSQSGAVSKLTGKPRYISREANKHLTKAIFLTNPDAINKGDKP